MDQDNYSQHIVFDRTKLEDFDEDEVREVLDLFISNTEDLIENIKKAANDNKVEEIFFYSHSLKGSSGNVGATRLYKYCFQVNAIIREMKTPNSEWISTLEDVFEATKAEMKS